MSMTYGQKRMWVLKAISTRLMDYALLHESEESSPLNFFLPGTHVNLRIRVLLMHVVRTSFAYFRFIQKAQDSNHMHLPITERERKTDRLPQFIFESSSSRI